MTQVSMSLSELGFFMSIGFDKFSLITLYFIYKFNLVQFSKNNRFQAMLVPVGSFYKQWAYISRARLLFT